MDISIKVKEEIFDAILSGEIKSLKRRCPKNYKNMRLFNNKIDNIFWVSRVSNRKISKIFSSIDIINVNEKKYIEIKFS